MKRQARARRNIVDDLQHRAPFVDAVVTRRILLEHDDARRQVAVRDVLLGGRMHLPRQQRPGRAVEAVRQRTDTDTRAVNAETQARDVGVQRAIALRSHQTHIVCAHRRSRELQCGARRKIGQRSHRQTPRDDVAKHGSVLQSTAHELGAQRLCLTRLGNRVDHHLAIDNFQERIASLRCRLRRALLRRGGLSSLESNQCAAELG